MDHGVVKGVVRGPKGSMRLPLAGLLLMASLALCGAPRAQQPAAKEAAGIDWVRVPAGELAMGAPDLDEDCRPVHRVKLGAFEMSRTEVTREQYARFLEATGRPKPAHWDHELFARPGSPVIGVTWQDAEAYCRWAGGRLPTEAEWEYAARGADGRQYPWGNQPPDKDRALFHLDIGFGGTFPAGTLKAGASPFGILDLAGNAFEWCADWYDPAYYAQSPAENPKGPARGELKVIRGGAWISFPDALRAAAREKYPPGNSSTLIGIRVVR